MLPRVRRLCLASLAVSSCRPKRSGIRCQHANPSARSTSCAPFRDASQLVFIVGLVIVCNRVSAEVDVHIGEDLPRERSPRIKIGMLFAPCIAPVASNCVVVPTWPVRPRTCWREQQSKQTCGQPPGTCAPCTILEVDAPSARVVARRPGGAAESDRSVPLWPQKPTGNSREPKYPGSAIPVQSCFERTTTSSLASCARTRTLLMRTVTEKDRESNGCQHSARADKPRRADLL